MATSLHRTGLALVLGPAFVSCALLSMGACGDVVVQSSGGAGGSGAGGSGGGTAGASSTSTSDPTSSTTSSSTGTGGDACTDAGGACIALVPDNCMNGTWLDANQYPCGTGEGVGCCVVQVCTPGQDQTCNAILSMSSFAGKCEDDGTCTCLPGFEKTPDGKCG